MNELYKMSCTLQIFALHFFCALLQSCAAIILLFARLFVFSTELFGSQFSLGWPEKDEAEAQRNTIAHGNDPFIFQHRLYQIQQFTICY